MGSVRFFACRGAAPSEEGLFVLAHGFLLVGDEASDGEEGDRAEGGTGGGLSVVGALLLLLGLGRLLGKRELDLGRFLVHEGRLDEVANLVDGFHDVITVILQLFFEVRCEVIDLTQEVVERILCLFLGIRESQHSLLDELINPGTIHADLDVHVGGLEILFELANHASVSGRNGVEGEHAPDIAGTGHSAGHKPVRLIHMLIFSVHHLLNDFAKGCTVDCDGAADKVGKVLSELLILTLLLLSHLLEIWGPPIDDAGEIVGEIGKGFLDFPVSHFCILLESCKLFEVEVDADLGVSGKDMTERGALLNVTGGGSFEESEHGFVAANLQVCPEVQQVVVAA